MPTTYTGQDGIKMGSFFRKAAFALRFGDINPLISGNITTSSKILIDRDIYARVRAIAPFLSWDCGPVSGGPQRSHTVGASTATRPPIAIPYAQRAITDGGGGLSGAASTTCATR